MRRPPVRPTLALLLLALLAGFPVGLGFAEDDEREREIIDLSPETPASFGAKNLRAPLLSLFRGPLYYYGERKIEVDTTPSGGLVDLFYVRSNFQKRFEQAETPVTVLLRPRVEAAERDVVRIRAFAEGYRQKEVSVRIYSSIDEVMIDLEPLPNTLEGLSHRYFAGRSSLGFLTKEALAFRLQEAPSGFAVVLTETAMAPEATAAIEHLQSPIIEEVEGQQLGEDLLVQVGLHDGVQDATEVRSSQVYNAARDLHEFKIDLVPADGGAAAVTRALDALASIGPGDVTGCEIDFDDTMRDQLDAGALNRALAPTGDFTDRYLRAAMRRLGEVTPGGVVEFTNGTRYNPTVPIELEVALSQGAQARGYLALLQRFVYGLEAPEFRAETLRSLIAPELDSSTFGVVLDKAESAKKACLAAATSSGVS